MKDLEEKITNIIEKPLLNMGFNIVRLRFMNPSKEATRILEIMIERLDDKRIAIGDCSKVSKYISTLLEIEDIIKGKYNLEISSAGVERPLIKIKDYQKYIGNVIKITLHNPIDSIKKFKGKLEDIDKQNLIKLKLDDKLEKIFEYQNIKDAKLVFTDELFRKLLK